MVGKIQYFLRQRGARYGSCAMALFLLAGLVWGVDFDRDDLPDDWSNTYEYTTNGYSFSNILIWSQMDQTNTSTTSVTDRSLNNLTGTITPASGHVPGL